MADGRGRVDWTFTGDADLRAALARIRSSLGATRVIADSGGTVNASLLGQGLVDVVDVVTLPGLVGGAGTPTMMDGPALLPEDLPIRLSLIDVRVEGDAVRTRYRIAPVDRDA